MADPNDEKFIDLTLNLAAKGRGKTSPNPMVGSVIAKKGRIIGQGYHKKCGTSHAEINAIKDAGKASLQGATLYVNLEPCCHHGKTGPCTDEIIKRGIKRVVFAHKDPNPKVAGKGTRILRKAGIEVSYGILRKDAESLNEHYIKYMTTGRPFVTLKSAQTLDGKIATRSGDSRWITGTKSRRYVHQLRAEHDAVMVGSGTVRADNPELTVRHVRGKNPYRIIVSKNPDFKRNISLFVNNSDARTILATTSQAASKINQKNLTIWEIKNNRDSLSLSDLLAKAGQFGITSILVEGGSALAASLLGQGLIDKHFLFIAPKIVGRGIDVVGDLKIKNMDKCLTYSNSDYYGQFNPDLLFVGYPQYHKRGKN